MMCQQDGCARRAELACVVGELRKVLCIEHQARYRQAMSCGGRSITVHHGVDLDDWAPPRPIRMAPVKDVPDLGFPLSNYVPPKLKVQLLPAAAMYSLANALEQLDLSHTPPPSPPFSPTTLRVIMPPIRPTCLWSDCAREAKQGSCCLIHNDRLRKIYGSAAKLSKSQINAAPEAWELRVATQYAARRGALVRSEAPVVVPVAPIVVPAVVPASKDAPNVPLAIVLLENALRHTRKDARLDALLAAAMAVLQ